MRRIVLFASLTAVLGLGLLIGGARSPASTLEATLSDLSRDPLLIAAADMDALITFSVTSTPLTLDITNTAATLTEPRVLLQGRC